MATNRRHEGNETIRFCVSQAGSAPKEGQALQTQSILPTGLLEKRPQHYGGRLLLFIACQWEQPRRRKGHMARPAACTECSWAADGWTGLKIAWSPTELPIGKNKFCNSLQEAGFEFHICQLSFLYDILCQTFPSTILLKLHNTFTPNINNKN